MTNIVVQADLDAKLAKVTEGIANAEKLAAAFAPHFVAFREQAELVLTVAPDDPARARAVRLALAKIRTSAEKERKALKDDSLRTGKAIDGYHAVLEHAIVPLEKAMLDVEVADARRLREARDVVTEARRLQLAPFCNPLHFAVADMTADEFAQLLDSQKAAKFAADNAAAIKREQDARREADERVARERLAAEVREANARADAARARADADKLAAAEQERTRKQQAEAAAAADAARKAECAPDRDKLLNTALEVACIVVPRMTSAQGIVLGAQVQSELVALVERIQGLAEGL